MKTRRFPIFVSTLGLLLAPLGFVSSASAATFTYSNNSSGTTQWNAGTNWSATPVSASTTTLSFAATQASGVNTVSNNDISGSFQLNKLNFTNVGPSSGTKPTLTISGNALRFVSDGATTPTILINPSAGNNLYRPALTIQNDLVLTNNLRISQGSTSNTFTIEGAISGAGALSKGGGGVVNLTNSTSTYAGGTILESGTFILDKVGTVGNASSLGSGSSIQLGSASATGVLQWNGTSETTDKVFTAGGSTGGAIITANTSGQTLTITQDVQGGASTSARTLTFNGSGNVTLDGSVTTGSGTVSLTKSGAGRLTLTGTAGDFTGDVTISQGDIYATSLGSTTSAGSLGKGSVLNLGGSGNTGTLRLLGTSDETTDKTLNMSGTTGGASITVTGATYTFNQNLGVTGTGDKTLTLSSSGGNSGQGINFNGLIADGSGSAISFRANGSGNTVFTLGNTANSFSGGVTVDGNTISRAYVLQANLIGNTGGGNSSLGTNGVVNLGSNTAGSLNILSYTGSGETTNKVINVSGNGGDAGLEQSATGLLKVTSNLTVSGTGAKTFKLRGSSTAPGEFAGNIVDGSGTISLEKSGTGTWTISGANTYTGATNVTSGKLVIDGSTSSTSLVTVDSAATLGGSGTIGGTTTISGIHSPGNSPGVQTFSNNLSYTTGASVLWELNGNTATQGSPTAVFDQILVGGDLDFTGATAIDLSFIAGGSVVNWNDSFWEIAHAGANGWLVYDVSGNTTHFSNFSISVANWQDGTGNLFNTVRSGASFGLEQVANDIYVTYTIVPEPTAVLLGGLGTLVLLRRRRP
jgi:fibronectin-binding autotransporter adhesin